MPCKDAMITDVWTVRPGVSVGEAMDRLEEKEIRTMPVVNEAGILVGLFSFRSVMKGLLPVSASMEDGLKRLDFIVGTSPGIAKRLRKLRKTLVDDCMEKDCLVLEPDMPTWEAVRMMALRPTPLPVVEPGTGRFLGLVTTQALIHDLQRTLHELEADEAAGRA